jgi:hypothetical protein
VNKHHRLGDPFTSVLAAHSMEGVAANQCDQLHAVYASNPNGLTDEEACNAAGLPARSHKRCSDLRNRGVITPTEMTRVALSGRLQQVCRLVDGDHPARARAQEETVGRLMLTLTHGERIKLTCGGVVMANINISHSDPCKRVSLTLCAPQRVRIERVDLDNITPSLFPQ